MQWSHTRYNQIVKIIFQMTTEAATELLRRSKICERKNDVKKTTFIQYLEYERFSVVVYTFFLFERKAEKNIKIEM